MFQGKTKHGVSIGSTVGMKQGTSPRVWFLVADRSRLLFFEKAHGESGAVIEFREEYQNPDGRKKGSDLVSDRPGRSFESQDRSQHGQAGGTRHAYGSASEPGDHVVEELIKKAANLLETKIGREGRLHIVAESGLMGLMKPALELVFPKIEIEFQDKDFAWLKVNEVKERLGALYL